jgi:2-haloacid dehalogenase
MGIWIDFWTLTQTSLDVAFAQFPNVDRRLRHRLLLAYRELDSYPDVRHCLSGLGAAGYRRAILSNGSADMLADAVRASGLTDVLEAIISVDEVRVFKPDGRVYQLACDTLGLQAHQVLFVSSNRWDVAGAAKFGFVPVWINRAGHPDEYPGLEPVLTLRDLSTLA